jgi:hypothetical protein
MGTSVPAILRETEAAAAAMAASPSASAAATGGFWSGRVGFGRRRGEKLGEIWRVGAVEVGGDGKLGFSAFLVGLLCLSEILARLFLLISNLSFLSLPHFDFEISHTYTWTVVNGSKSCLP